MLLLLEGKGGREWLLDFMFQLYVDGRMYEYVKKKESTSHEEKDKSKRSTKKKEAAAAAVTAAAVCHVRRGSALGVAPVVA